MADFTPGVKTTFSDAADHILDLKDGLDFLNPRMDGIGLLKRLGTSKMTAKAIKHEWVETILASRRDTVTIADGTTTTVTVPKARQYQINNLVRCENEVMRVTAIPSATTLTVTRGYAGTTGVAHSAKPFFSMGAADPENSLAPAGTADMGDRFFNYVQTLTRSVEMSNDEIANLSVDGNPMTGQIKRRFIELNRELAMAVFYGVRYEDTTNLLHSMGGLKQYVTSNVSNVAGALTIAAIDAQILAIVEAGGDPKIIGLSPYQKQKLDALDANKQMLGKQEHVGGNLITQTWQSGLLDHTLDIYVDHGLMRDELWILDTDHIAVGPLSNNGVNGAFHVENATAPGQDGEKKVMRGKYTMEVGLQAGQAYLYGLT